MWIQLTDDFYINTDDITSFKILETKVQDDSFKLEFNIKGRDWTRTVVPKDVVEKLRKFMRVSMSTYDIRSVPMDKEQNSNQPKNDPFPF